MRLLPTCSLMLNDVKTRLRFAQPRRRLSSSGIPEFRVSTEIRVCCLHDKNSTKGQWHNRLHAVYSSSGSNRHGLLTRAIRSTNKGWSAHIMYTLANIVAAIAATIIVVSLIAAMFWRRLAHRSNTPDNAVNKLFRSVIAKTKRFRSADEVANDFNNLKNKLSDISRELCERSEQFCFEVGDMLNKWMTEHIDDYIYENPNKIIELGEFRINALKLEINQLKLNMRIIIADALLSSHGGVYLDDIEFCNQSIINNIDKESLPADDVRPIRNEIESIKFIDRKLSEIAGRLGDIMASYGLIHDNHQRWIKQKDSDNYKYIGTILWTDAMRSLFSGYMTLKAEYHEHIARIPALQTDRLRIEAKNIWGG